VKERPTNGPSAEDVKTFTELSGDKGIQYVQPDGKGRIMVQGLLTATIPTKLGGDINYVAREISFQFVKSVFVGDTVRCEAAFTKVESGKKHLSVAVDFVCRNQHGEEVLLGKTHGVIPV